MARHFGVFGYSAEARCVNNCSQTANVLTDDDKYLADLVRADEGRASLNVLFTSRVERQTDLRRSRQTGTYR
jgi:hypothetical protein